MAGGGGGRRWQDEVEPELRSRLIQQTVAKIHELFRAKKESPPEGLYEDVANVENEAFMTAKDKIDYLRRVSYMLSRCQNQAQLQAAARRQKQMEMMHQIQLANTVQAIHGCNPSFTAVPLAVPMMANPSRPTFQSPNQQMAHPFASNRQINVNQGPSDMVPMLYHTFNSQPAMVAPVAQSVGQQILQPITMRSHNQHPVMQLQPTNIAQCHWENVAQLQGQPIAQPNGNQSYLLSQNGYAYAQHPQPTAQQQYFGINQQQVGMQRYQILGANVAKMNHGYSGRWNNQQYSGIQSLSRSCEQVELKRQTNMESQLMPPAERQITINQQVSNVHCPSPQSQARMESPGEVDWREEMVQQIKSLKDAYFSELVELDQNFVLQRLTEDQFKSLPREKVDSYNQMLQRKVYISHVLEFLQLKKSLETYRGKLPMYKKIIHLLLGQGKRKVNEEINTRQESETINLTADIAPFTGSKSYQQKLSADESIDQVRQNVVTTPSAEKKTNSKQLQEVTGPCFSMKSPGALQSSPINDVGFCCMLSLTDKSGVASPNALLQSRSQSSIAHPGVIAVASPSLSTKSTLTSTVDKSGFVATSSSCSSVKSASPSAIAKSGILQVASPSDGDSSSLLHSDGTVNCCNLTPEAPCQTHIPAGQAEDQEHGGAETPVAKKPIDRLIAAVLASSPAVLRSSVNLIESTLTAMDLVPSFQKMDSEPSRIESNRKMKRDFFVTSASQLPTLGSTDGSTVTIEFDASDSTFSSNRSVKRQKMQNTKDGLLDEIEAVNSRLIDTVISITSDNTEDGAMTETLVKLSYTAVSLAPSLKSQFATTGNLQPLVMPMTLSIPADYPRSSPVIVDDEGDAQLRTKFSCISVAVDAAFRRELGNLQEPRSLKETARVWDSCVRRAITEYAYLLSGGTLSSSIEHVRVGSAQEKRGMHSHWNNWILCE